jgi:hypothetical protein
MTAHAAQECDHRPQKKESPLRKAVGSLQPGRVSDRARTVFAVQASTTIAVGKSEIWLFASNQPRASCVNLFGLWVATVQVHPICRHDQGRRTWTRCRARPLLGNTWRFPAKRTSGSGVRFRFRRNGSRCERSRRRRVRQKKTRGGCTAPRVDRSAGYAGPNGPHAICVVMV